MSRRAFRIAAVLFWTAFILEMMWWNARPAAAAEKKDVLIAETIPEDEGRALLKAMSETPSSFMERAETAAAPGEDETEVDPDELYLLAHLICGEAQGYSRELQEAVGSVVLNRAADPRYPDTIKEVIYQKGQYACIKDGNFDREPTETNWAVAEELLKEGSKIPAGVIFQAQFKQGPLWKKIGNEYFCYGKRETDGRGNCKLEQRP